MTQFTLPAPLREFIDSTNSGDSERFVATFTEDAHLNDWGRVFRGHDGVREWDRTDNIGKQTRFEILDVAPGRTPESYVVTVKVTGNGFNGTSPLAFILRDDRIADLRIS